MADLFISAFAFQDVCNISVSRYDKFLEATSYPLPLDKVSDLWAEQIEAACSFPCDIRALYISSAKTVDISFPVVYRDASLCLLYTRMLQYSSSSNYIFNLLQDFTYVIRSTLRRVYVHHVSRHDTWPMVHFSTRHVTHADFSVVEPVLGRCERLCAPVQWGRRTNGHAWRHVARWE